MLPITIRMIPEDTIKKLDKLGRLFLDDFRKPYYPNWTLVKDYNELVSYIKRKGLPAVISLDHDLHAEHYQDYNDGKIKFSIEYSKFKYRTGFHALQFILGEVVHYREAPFILIHTANPTGARMMESAIKLYKISTGREIKYRVVKYGEEVDWIEDHVKAQDSSK